jgi:hypothetical protein
VPVSLLPSQLCLASQVRDGLGEVANRNRLDAGERRLGSARLGAEELVDRRARCALRDGKDAADAAQATVQAELTHGGVLR